MCDWNTNYNEIGTNNNDFLAFYFSKIINRRNLKHYTISYSLSYNFLYTIKFKNIKTNFNLFKGIFNFENCLYI